jgi:hypothetical protein
MNVAFLPRAALQPAAGGGYLASRVTNMPVNVLL